MRSFFAAALCFSLIHACTARERRPHSFRDLIERDAQTEPESVTGNGIWQRFLRILRKDLIPRQDGTCYEDDYYNFTQSLGAPFCQRFMNYPNVTQTVDYTPTSTVFSTFTTKVQTRTQVSRVTPVTTTTVTYTAGSRKAKRAEGAKAADGSSLEMEVQEAFQMYRRQNGNAPGDAALSTSFSSACSCNDFSGPTNTVTYTDEPTLTTELAFGNTQTTTTTTRTAVPQVTTQIVTVRQPTSSPAPPSNATTEIETTGTTATILSASSAPTPTAPPFVCPQDNGTIVSNMVNSERFDYLILCDTKLTDPDLYDQTNYTTLGECSGACSLTDNQFDYPVCQGVSFDASGDSSNGTCMLKFSANSTVPAPGIDSALLQRIAIGIDNTTTTTESEPFLGHPMTQNPQEMSSSMSSMLGNSTQSMPMITPGPIIQSGMMVQAGYTAYSTQVSAGKTFSSGTAYSFSTQYPNGSWYYDYQTSYTIVWSSATTIYGASETGLAITNSSSSQSQESSGADGGWSIISTTNYTTPIEGGVNVTEVMTNQTYNAEGAEISSSATTQYFSYQTAGGESGSGGGIPSSNSTNSMGSGNGGAGGGGGGPASGSAGLTTSTSTYTTETLIVNSGGTGGSSGLSGYGGPAPSTIASTIVQSFGSAYSSGFILSGGPTGTSGASSVMASGGPISGSVSISTISVILNSYGTGGSSGMMGSGGAGGTGGASSTIGSGGPSSSTSTPFSNSEGPRAGTISTSPSSNATVPLSTGTSPNTSTISMLPSGTALGYSAPGAPRAGTISTSPSRTAPGFSAPGAPRSGTIATSPSGTAPGFSAPGAPRSGTIATSPSGTAPTYSAPGAPRSGTIPPFSTGPSAYPHFPVTGAPPFPGFPTGGYNGPLQPLPSPSGTAPGTAPNNYPFNNSAGARGPGHPTGGYHHGTTPSFLPTPSGTAPGTAPLATPSANSTLPTAPSGSAPGTAPNSYPFSNSAGGRGPGHLTSGTHPSNNTAPTVPSVTGPILSTQPSTVPTPPSSCYNATMGTTTIFSTITIFGCASTCMPHGSGGYPGPEPFGPPFWGTAT